MKNFNILRQKLYDLINQKLESLNLEIYQINNHQEFAGDVLQILVQDKLKNNKRLDFDILVKANEIVSRALDDVKEIIDPYLLEVASAGIEKEIRTYQELQKALDEYLYIQLNQQVKNISEFMGYLVNYDDQSKIFKFEFFVKGQPKKIELSW
ncbi:Ribosome maturation factor RimP, partial [Mycoplasma putrefaciens]